MTEISVREGTASDIGSILELQRHFETEILEERGGTLWVAQIADKYGALEVRFERYRSSEQFRCAIASFHNAIAGYAATQIESGTVAPTVANVLELYVEPEFRNLGIGEALIADASDWGRKHNAGYLESSVLPGARISKNFFEAHAMKARLLRVSKPIAE